MAKYSVTQSAVTQLLADVKSDRIAIPELQRPFVWDSVKVRDLMDSLYKGSSTNPSQERHPGGMSNTPEQSGKLRTGHRRPVRTDHQPQSPRFILRSRRCSRRPH